MVIVEVRLTVPDDIKEILLALHAAWQLMEELREDMPWRDEPEEAQSIVKGVFTDLYKYGCRNK